MAMSLAEADTQTAMTQAPTLSAALERLQDAESTPDGADEPLHDVEETLVPAQEISKCDATTSHDAVTTIPAARETTQAAVKTADAVPEVVDEAYQSYSKTPANTSSLQRSSALTDSAVHTLVNCPELLETLLLNLDMHTLLHTQRVNRQFKATIDDSVKLQRALWFLPDPNIVANDSSQIVGNPIILKQTGDYFVLNSRSKTSLPIDRLRLEPGGEFNRVMIYGSSAPETQPKMDSSWQKMFLTQPFDPKMAYRFAYIKADEERYEEMLWVVSKQYTEAPTLGEIINDIIEWDDVIRAEWNAGSLYVATHWTDVWSPGIKIPKALK